MQWDKQGIGPTTVKLIIYTIIFWHLIPLFPFVFRKCGKDFSVHLGPTVLENGALEKMCVSQLIPGKASQVMCGRSGNGV